MNCPWSYLISFEGIDTAGKTTQVQKLYDFLQADKRIAVELLPEFSKSVIGNLLTELVSKNKFVTIEPARKSPFAETLLLLSDFFVRQEFLEPTSKPLVIIADRHQDSLIAYQIPRIRDMYPRFTDDELLDWLLGCIKPANAEPDLTFIITLPVEHACARIQERDFYTPTKYDRLFLNKAQGIFKALMERNPKRFYEIDGTQSIENISLVVRNVILESLSYRLGLK